MDQIDLLLVIDNSASMADKQAILASAVPDLVRGLVNPRCLDQTNKAVPNQPSGPKEDCPQGSVREFDPVLDIHVGLISSSLGSRGANTCSATDTPTQKITPANDDRGHLLARTVSTKGSLLADQDVATYGGKGFLAWDPGQTLHPAGIKEIGDLDGTPGIVPTLSEMVKGAGEDGCGYESQLESWYRFLVDPEPYDTISFNKGQSVPTDIDHVVLEERKDFLRPSSLVAIILLTDENDCSITEAGLGWTAAQSTQVVNGKSVAFHLPPPRHECAIDPNDPCCKSCGLDQGTCPPDPVCAEKALSPDKDPANLRCFDQKRRFGFDFLYSLDRYTNALTRAKIPNRKAELVDNPLFPKPNAATGEVTPRTPDGGLVFFAGIVGVPWQDIARKTGGVPDLKAGLDANNKPVGGFKTSSELATPDDVTGRTGWDEILGDPDKGVLADDALMHESRDPRTGKVPSLNVSLAPETSTTANANEINGHEWLTSAMKGGDLQYACIFKLPTAKPHCTDDSCACNPAAKNPLCQDDQGNYTDTEFRAKAYPGLRELGVLKEIGDQGIVASVCPAQLDKPGVEDTDYGYRPATGAIIDQLKSRLNGKCLHRALSPDKSGEVACLVIEARTVPAGQTCSCASPAVGARQDVLPKHEGAKREIIEDPAAMESGWNCFCEIKQLEGDALHACQFDTSPTPKTTAGAPADGWCYIDPTSNPPAGEGSLVEGCNATERRKLRFVGKGEQLDKSTLFISCSGR